MHGHVGGAAIVREACTGCYERTCVASEKAWIGVAFELAGVWIGVELLDWIRSDWIAANAVSFVASLACVWSLYMLRMHVRLFATQVPLMCSVKHSTRI